MSTLAKLVNSFGNLILAFLGLNGNEDKYLPIEVKVTVDEKKVIPFARTDLPDLGHDHESLVKQAEHLYTDDVLRYKWLIAIYKLRTSQVGWIMDPSNKNKPFTKWGLTRPAC